MTLPAVLRYVMTRHSVLLLIRPRPAVVFHSVLRNRPTRAMPSLIASREAAYDKRTWVCAVAGPKSAPGVNATCASRNARSQKSHASSPVDDTLKYA